MSILSNRYLWSTDAWKFWHISSTTNTKESELEEERRYKISFYKIKKRLNAKEG